MKTQKGFSLIELLIVVVIIGIVAAIAIPNLLAARIAANEASAIASLRTYHSAQLVYQATAGAGKFAGATHHIGSAFLGNPAADDAFAVLASQQLIDSVLGTGVKSGYQFRGLAGTTANNVAQFIGAAKPANFATFTPGGRRQFYIITNGEIAYDNFLDSPTNWVKIKEDANGGFYYDTYTPLGDK